MLRVFGQFVAIIAVMATAINAQCALSCSLQLAKRITPHQASSVESSRPSHPCCPVKKSPVPEKQNGNTLCPDAVPALSAAGVSGSSQFVTAPLSLEIASTLPAVPTLPRQLSTLPALVDSSGLRGGSAFSVLRI